MEVTVLAPATGVVVIEVIGEDYQSYSRAFSPRATRAWKHAVEHIGGTWHLTAEYGVRDDELAPRRTRNVYTYTREG